MKDGPKVLRSEPEGGVGGKKGLKKPMQRSRSLLVMGSTAAKTEEVFGKTGWAAVANAVFFGEDPKSKGMSATVMKAEQTKLSEVLTRRPDQRTEEDLRFLKKFLLAKAADWPFLSSKPLDFFDEFVKMVTLETRYADDEIYKENDRAHCVYVVLEGSVALYATVPPEDDGHAHTVDWSAIKSSLNAVQTSLDGMKESANVQASTAVVGIRKPEPVAHSDDGSGGGVGKEPRSSPTSAGQRVVTKSLAVYNEETKTLDARKTWGRVFGGLQLAGVLASATEELEKSVKKAHTRTAESHFMGFVRVGEALGEAGILERRPGEAE